MEERRRSDRRRSKRRLIWIVSVFAILLVVAGAYQWFNREEPIAASQPKQEAVQKKVAAKEKVAEKKSEVETETVEPEKKEVSTPEEPVVEEPTPAEPEMTDVEKYPEAIESVVRIGENMNAIYVAADELEQRFTPYVEKDGLRQFEFVPREELKDLFVYDSNLSIEITSSTHFDAPDYTQEGFRQTREAHLIIVKELEQLDALLEDYRGKFRQDPEGTLAQVKGHFERIKAATQMDLPGFEQFFKTAKTEGS
ncbi:MULTISPECIES: hypothetical protein [unclassified Exiguobacterium]|uniref:hypothetical protein n=1 Tax=unclassified Exiguobacterium TaxID=2644629 RepID=UPI0025C105CB|nr:MULTISPECIES: hypothetical protein [unclassified Exiguobacterium]